jgi:tRNA A37 N6-isopentenylltransferase MiaA
MSLVYAVAESYPGFKPMSDYFKTHHNISMMSHRIKYATFQYVPRQRLFCTLGLLKQSDRLGSRKISQIFVLQITHRAQVIGR